MAQRRKQGDCSACGGQCCRYITVQIPRPRNKADIDEVRWFLAHEGVSVYIEDGQWHVQAFNRCRYLTADYRCAIYENRFDVCREHDPTECESSDGAPDAVEFHTTAEFDAYLSRVAARGSGRRRRPSRTPTGPGRAR